MAISFPTLDELKAEEALIHQDRQVQLMPASQFEVKAWPHTSHEDITQAVRDFIPDHLRILPDGRDLATVIATRAAANYDARTAKAWNE